MHNLEFNKQKIIEEEVSKTFRYEEEMEKKNAEYFIQLRMQKDEMIKEEK